MVLSSLLNFNQITFCQVLGSEIAAHKWFGRKLINDGLPGASEWPLGEPSGAPWVHQPRSLIATRQWQEPLPENESKPKNGRELVPIYRQQPPRRIPRLSGRAYIQEDNCLISHPSHSQGACLGHGGSVLCRVFSQKAGTNAVQDTKIKDFFRLSSVVSPFVTVLLFAI